MTPLRILMVAPQPFFRPRGTPFSILHRIRALGEAGCRIDLITYPFGDDVELEGLRIRRCARPPGISDVRIGPSLVKLVLDVPLAVATRRALGSGDYDVLHSHEEAAFFCAPLARRFRLPHVYDMHSSLPQQLENFGSFNLPVFRKLFARLERHVLKTCAGVITICRDLADIVERECPGTPHAMIENTADDSNVFGDAPAPAALTGLPAARRIVLYTGTFEPYQGIELLLGAFARVAAAMPDAHLVLVGGRPHQVEAERARAGALGLRDRSTFVGQVHPTCIPAYLARSEVIVSPRASGTNTPLKIYGYLRSGRPIVATNLYTHTQTLNAEVAELCDATPAGLAAGILRVLQERPHAERLVSAARRLSDAEYSDEAYVRKVKAFYGAILNRSGDKSAANSAPAVS